MLNRRPSRQSSGGISRISDDQIIELVSKLRQLLPEIRNRRSHKMMYHGGYTAEITSLSPKATEKDVVDFFAYCGAIQHVEIIRCGEAACTAYVTFKDAYPLETAVLLSGATIVDQSVCISRWGSCRDDAYPLDGSTWRPRDDTSSTVFHVDRFVSTPREAVTVVKTMLAKGYVLGKDAVIKAKELDESYRLSANAAAKVAELSNRIGLTENFNTSMETIKSVDEKYHVSDITKSVALVTGTAALMAATFTGRTAVAAANAVVHSRYFSKGALWVSDKLSCAAQAAADFGSHENK